MMHVHSKQVSCYNNMIFLFYGDTIEYQKYARSRDPINTIEMKNCYLLFGATTLQIGAWIFLLGRLVEVKYLENATKTIFSIY